jgi:hypothetical protein
MGICRYSVKRGGASSGGGYDRMNFTRKEACGKPAEGESGLCARHKVQFEKDMAKLRRSTDLINRRIAAKKEA